MKWPRGVHQGYARRDGLSPDDFNYLQWPVTDVRLEQPGLDDPSRAVLVYRCRFPTPPPVDNQYEEDASAPQGHRRLPDPVGLCLARVRFEVRDCDSHDLLHVEPTLGTPDGEVVGFDVGESSETWTRIRPGGSLWVQLTARPFFYYLGEDGGMKGQYAVGHRGYFAGKVVSSPEYRLAVSDDHDAYGAVLVDGKARPQRPDPEVDQDSIDEYNRLKVAEEAERKRLEREQEEQLERDRIEQREREARWAREDAEREAQRRREEERAAAERKRNEKYIQRDTVDPSKYEMLVEHLGIHFAWTGCPVEEKVGFLQKVTGMGPDWKAAAEQVAGENGWDL